MVGHRQESRARAQAALACGSAADADRLERLRREHIGLFCHCAPERRRGLDLCNCCWKTIGPTHGLSGQLVCLLKHLYFFNVMLRREAGVIQLVSNPNSNVLLVCSKLRGVKSCCLSVFKLRCTQQFVWRRFDPAVCNSKLHFQVPYSLRLLQTSSLSISL